METPSQPRIPCAFLWPNLRRDCLKRVIHFAGGMSLAKTTRPVSLARTPGRVATTMEDRGGSTAAVLEELGFDADEVRRFHADRVI